MNYKRINLSLILLFFSGVSLFAQTASRPGKYWIYFTDKANNGYSIHEPARFLSARAIDRRAKLGIDITEQDLPVNRTYVEGIKDKGAKVYNITKWFNAALVKADSALVSQLYQLPFVDSVEYVGRYHEKRFLLKKEGKERDVMQNYPALNEKYGFGTRQVNMIRADELHDLGFQGDGLLVGVFDGGFMNVDIMPFFDTLRAQNRLFEGRDFVDADDWLYESSTHGSQVLSVMASNLPGLLIGSAPDATYVLFKTEDTRSESWSEECNWIAAAEFADSLGIDVINSSLGYTTFNEESMNYSHDKMNGNYARISRAANIAFSKGILVVNSAGNEGRSSWKHIGAPADAENVLAIGAVDLNEKKAGFSSVGPSGDGRLKPNISAAGLGIIVGSTYSYQVQPSSGTSFASPLMTGAATALWQAFPEKTNAEIFEALEATASQAENPDYLLGYGIPDMVAAFQYLAGNNAVIVETENALNDYQVLLPSHKDIYLLNELEDDMLLVIYNQIGEVTGEYPLNPKIRKINIEPFRASGNLLYFRLKPYEKTDMLRP